MKAAQVPPDAGDGSYDDILVATALPDERIVEAALRPRTLAEFVGQERVREQLSLILEAARAYVTMGEMCDVWRDVWGVWRETPVF